MSYCYMQPDALLKPSKGRVVGHATGLFHQNSNVIYDFEPGKISRHDLSN